ncbi:hypothetical protein BC832DRAFT_591652 [Gaertneriomyces semiglobifer]|nr:hypothetical protein BC832DRAFT_591652 [Gaertneriomyces semiglobifer]
MKDNTLDPIKYAQYLNATYERKDEIVLSLKAAVDWVKERAKSYHGRAKANAARRTAKRLAEYPWNDQTARWAKFWAKLEDKHTAATERRKRDLQGERELTSRSEIAVQRTLRKVQNPKRKRDGSRGSASEAEEPRTPERKRSAASTPFLHTPQKPRLKVSTKFETTADVIFLFRGSRNTPSAIQAPYVAQMNEIHDLTNVPTSVQEMMKDVTLAPISNVPQILLSLDNQDDKHLHVAQSVLYVWAMVRHMSGNVLVSGTEWKHLIEQVSPLFKHMEHTFHTIVFDWVERPVNSTKALREMAELASVEHSGTDANIAQPMKHAGDDTVKLHRWGEVSSLLADNWTTDDAVLFVLSEQNHISGKGMQVRVLA